ncbi:MAG TPA: sulfite exporter TauE/SafE family protein, partial [Verrucomicrobiae bacterium]|nr:sulfite exporter TauE/SafE family protein [Verrucomicrobiae bacterium]
GLWALRRAFKHNVHAHEHEHQGERHIHFHVHSHPAQHNQSPAHDRHTHTAFAIGTLHGLAGSSHVLGILPMLALPTKTQAITYLIAFGSGTILAMAGFSSVVGWLTRRYATNRVNLYRGLMGTCAVAAMAIGCVWFAGHSW